MDKRNDLEAFVHFIENSKKDEIEHKNKLIKSRNKLVLTERELFQKLPRWVQDRYIKNFHDRGLPERVSWLQSMTSNRYKSVQPMLDKKNVLSTKLHKELHWYKKTGEEQRSLRLEYAEFVENGGDPSSRKWYQMSQQWHLCPNCKSINAQTKRQTYVEKQIAKEVKDGYEYRTEIETREVPEYGVETGRLMYYRTEEREVEVREPKYKTVYETVTVKGPKEIYCSLCNHIHEKK